MATYVMSDIHGEGVRFQAMLEKIRFADDDTLYILGDVIDRGPDGVALLQQILASPNMVLLLGNHEQMCLDYYRADGTLLDLIRWSRNGNEPTLNALEQLPAGKRKALLKRLSGLADHLEITVGERRFYLVHGCPADAAYDRIWGRPAWDMAPPEDGSLVILGHTPVVFYTTDRVGEEPFRILHAPGFIDVDCGCGHSYEQRRLACLRLEDMEEFYC